MSNIIAYLSLDDFINDVVPDDAQIRVEVIQKSLNSKGLAGDLIQWLVIVTAKMFGDIAMTSILVGEAWNFAIEDEPWHQDNADEAVWLVRKYLGNLGFATAPGVWNPKDVTENLVYASTDLWHFEDKRLVPNDGDLATGTALAEDDPPPGGQPGDTKSLQEQPNNAHDE